MRKFLPVFLEGAIVETPEGQGVVMGVSLLKELVR